ncbi:hypothetical protein GCM10018773_41390 [Streptomyces candidus]|nr:hypothetical protein GCM10018773_41390 [Streptomyces candidus]
MLPSALLMGTGYGRRRVSTPRARAPDPARPGGGGMTGTTRGVREPPGLAVTNANACRVWAGSAHMDAERREGRGCGSGDSQGCR